MRLGLILTAPLLACACLLATPAAAQAQYYRGGSYRLSSYHPSNASTYAPHHMPGWDWWRTYPWSPYNYGRNPYNPIILPSPAPYVYPYPAYPYYVGPLATYPTTPPDGAMFPSNQGPAVMMPQPTGPTSTPPADAALVLVRVADTFAQVRFNGERTYTNGTTRYFVTPSLQPGKTYSYSVSATVTRDGQPTTEDRQVKVTRGHTTVVDFTRPAQK